MPELSLDIEPQFVFWPECKQCGTAYVYRRAYSKMHCQWRWYWQPDCFKAEDRRDSTPTLASENTTSLMTTSGITLKINRGYDE